MNIWLISIINITAAVMDAMIINRGITDSCLSDIILGSVLLFANLGCLVLIHTEKQNKYYS